jgi:hypothetical protein
MACKSLDIRYCGWVKDQSVQKKRTVPEDSTEKHTLLQRTPDLSNQRRALPAIAPANQREGFGLVGFEVCFLTISNFPPKYQKCPQCHFTNRADE